MARSRNPAPRAVRICALAAASVMLAAASGCRSAPPTLAADPEIRELQDELAGRAAPARLALAPVTLAYESVGDLSEDSSRYPARVDRAELLESMAGAIASHAGYERPVVADQGGDLAGAFAEAWEAGADILIRPVVPRLDCVFRGRNWSYWPNLAVFIYAWVPSFWIADEDYALEGELLLELYSVASERLLYQQKSALDAEWALDDFERGWSWTGIVTAPKTLDEDDWAQVAKSLADHGSFLLGRAAALEAGRGLRTYLDGDAFEKRDATVWALSVGVSRHRGGLLGPVGAGVDAQKVGEVLQSASGLPAKNVRLLVDEQATRAGIQTAFQGFLGRSRPRDTVLIYWSGLGARVSVQGGGDPAAGARPVLLPFDAHPETLSKSALSLERLRELCAAVPAKRIVVVLDASFGDADAPATRSLDSGEEGARAATAVSEALLPPWTDRRDGKEISLYLAAGPAQDALELVDAGRGLFTFLFEEAVGGAADDDHDGTVTGREVIGFLEREVRAQAGLDGVDQLPRLYRLGARVRPTDPLAPEPWLRNSGS